MTGSKVAAARWAQQPSCNCLSLAQPFWRTQWPSRKCPRWYLRCMNLPSSILTVRLGPPICTGGSSNYWQQTSRMHFCHSITDFRDIPVFTQVSACLKLCHHQYIQSVNCIRVRCEPSKKELTVTLLCRLQIRHAQAKPSTKVSPRRECSDIGMSQFS